MLTFTPIPGLLVSVTFGICTSDLTTSAPGSGSLIWFWNGPGIGLGLTMGISNTKTLTYRDIAMSSSRADPVGLNSLSYCPGWGYLNI